MYILAGISRSKLQATRRDAQRTARSVCVNGP